MRNINDNESEQKNGKMKKVLKKGVGIGLCAVLAGGLAAGTFEGVNRITGWNQTENVQAAINRNDGVTLLKSEKSSDSDEKTKAKGSLDVSDIVEEAMPSVVSISTKSIEEVQNYFGIFRQYGYAPQAPQEREVEGSGSGIIVGKNDDELLVATNYHVVEGADTLSVCFIDGNAYEAKVKGYDADKDLAVVAVALDDLSDDTLDEISIATIGSSDDLKVGEQVIAIGNALGYGQSVTTGIVSAKNRRANSDYSQTREDGDSDEENTDGINLIQTDAAINPGNRGGALLNMDGEVVGINSAKLASTEVEGIGYAIAISDVSDILEDLMNEETRDKVEDGEHGVLGIMGSTVSEEGSQVYGIPEGVFVKEVTEGGGAEKAGIQENSVITKFDGKTVTSIEELVDLLEYYEPGEKVEVTLQIPHGNSYKEETVTVKLGKSTDTEEKDDDKDSDDTRDNLFKDFEENEDDGFDQGGDFDDWQ